MEGMYDNSAFNNVIALNMIFGGFFQGCYMWVDNFTFESKVNV